MQPEETTVAVSDGDVPIVAFSPDGQGLPGLVVVPSIFGIDDDLRRTKGEIDRAKARGGALDFNVGQRDLQAVLEAVRAETACNGRAVALGICFGGSHVFMAGARRWCDGVAAWHGTGIGRHLRHAIDVQCPISLHFGGRDEIVPMDEVRKIEDAMLRHPDVEIIVHATAGHGFSHAGWPQHVPQAESAGIESVQRLLARFK